MCAMNPRLLRPILSGDPDALRYIAAVQKADGQSLEAGVKKAITDFVTGCKSDGIWDAIKASCILAGARTLAGALTPLKGTAPTNNNFVAGDYSRNGATPGILGNGVNKWISTGRNNNADPQNDKHASVYASVLATSGSNEFPRMLSSGNSLSPDTMLHRNQNNGNLIVNCNATVFDSPAATAGFLGVSRSSGTQYNFRGNSTTTTFNRNSGTPRDAVISLYNDPALTAGQYANARLAFYSIGEALDLAALDTRVTALIAAIGNS